jgi:hypothetical protein
MPAPKDVQIMEMISLSNRISNMVRGRDVEEVQTIIVHVAVETFRRHGRSLSDLHLCIDTMWKCAGVSDSISSVD